MSSIAPLNSALDFLSFIGVSNHKRPLSRKETQPAKIRRTEEPSTPAYTPLSERESGDIQKIAREIFNQKLVQYGVGEPLKTLGGTICAGVFKKALTTSDPSKVAVIATPSACPETLEESKIAEQEVNFLQQFQGASHIPILYDQFSVPNEVYAMIQENIGPTLYEAFLDRNNPYRLSITLSQIERITKKLLESLATLHKNGVIHGDVKPGNCSFGGHLFDFNLSGKGDPNGAIPGIRYTGPYRSPEGIILEKSFFASDIWALGCTLYELWGGTYFIPVFDKEDPLQEDINRFQAFADRLQIRYLEGTISPKYFENGVLKPSTLNRLNPLEKKLEPLRKDCKGGLLADLITAMLKFEPAERITAEEALAHPFFQSETFDRSFHLQISGSRNLTFKILYNDKPIEEVFNLGICPPLSCRHIDASLKPYCFELSDPTTQQIAHFCNLSLPIDGKTISIDQDAVSITLL